MKQARTIRTVVAAVLEADLAHQLGHPLLVRLDAGDRQREDDVLLGVQHREKIEELEDEADVLTAKPGQLGVVQLRDLRPRDAHLAGGRLVEAGQDVHEGRLPGP